jgi:release factor glutamine methyltransferase
MNGDMTVRRALAQAGLVSLDAQVLLAHVLGKDRAWLIAHDDDALAREQSEAYFALAARRRDGEPVAQLELALARLPKDRDARVLDLGTGSGAIALALAYERPRAAILATDVSAEALAVARENARRLHLHNVEFVQADWYAGVPLELHGAPFDLIASNPPYVANQDPRLREGDVRFEPALALASGRDGLDAVRCIVAGARERMRTGATLVVEHGYDQGDKVHALFAAAGFAAIVTARDLAGISRVVAGCPAA